jgi:UDP-N-acetylglucosamine enolpyruvyl transferase
VLGFTDEKAEENIEHIDRGYYKFEENLRDLGADIKRVED